MAIFSEATDLGFLEEFAAFDFWRFFQRQLILNFLKNLLPLIFGDFSEATDLGFLEEFAASGLDGDGDIKQMALSTHLHLTTS